MLKNLIVIYIYIYSCQIPHKDTPNILSNIKESKENTRLGILFRPGESTDFNISKNKRRILSNLYQHIAKYVLEHIKTVTPN